MKGVVLQAQEQLPYVEREVDVPVILNRQRIQSSEETNWSNYEDWSDYEDSVGGEYDGDLYDSATFRSGGFHCMVSPLISAATKPC